MLIPATYRSHWRSSAPWCCLLSARCRKEGKPLTLRRQDQTVIVTNALPSRCTHFKLCLKSYLQTSTGSVELIVCARCSAELRACAVMKILNLKHFWSTYLLPHSSRQGWFAAARIYSPADRPVFVLQLQRTKCFCTGPCIFWWRRRGLGCVDG